MSHKIMPSCIKCHSNQVTSRGRLQNGDPLYYCRTCKSLFALDVTGEVTAAEMQSRQAASAATASTVAAAAAAAAAAATAAVKGVANTTQPEERKYRCSYCQNVVDEPGVCPFCGGSVEPQDLIEE